jgi:hypothetical protein
MNLDCEFISSYFSEINVESIQLLDVCALKDILNSDSLQIVDEDWLLKLSIELGLKCLELLGSVRFEYLGSSSIDLFFEHICFENIDPGIWHQLWLRSHHRLIYSSNELSLNRFKNCSTRRPQPDSASMFSGLVHHLCDESHGNVHEQGVVTIMCSSRIQNECW